jgi:hypothetical protein
MSPRRLTRPEMELIIKCGWSGAKINPNAERRRQMEAWESVRHWELWGRWGRERATGFGALTSAFPTVPVSP